MCNTQLQPYNNIYLGLISSIAAVEESLRSCLHVHKNSVDRVAYMCGGRVSLQGAGGPFCGQAVPAALPCHVVLSFYCGHVLHFCCPFSQPFDWCSPPFEVSESAEHTGADTIGS
jgi:hypothetical protein